MDFIAGLHPKFVHFPIALFLTYTLLEITGIVFKKELFSKAAYIILILGILGGVAAVFTGDRASEAAEKLSDLGVIVPLGSISRHEDYATYTLWYFVALTVFRTYLIIRKKFTGTVKYLFIVLALIGSLLVYETALLGGRLVYQHGVGTDLIQPEKTNIQK